MLMETVEKRLGTFQNKNTYWHALQEGAEAEFDRQYEAAVASVRENLVGKNIPLVIDGKEVTTGEWMEWRSPADQDIVVCRFPKATKQHAKDAIAAASAGEKAWAQTPWTERADLVDKVADLFTRDFYELCAIMTFETGKSRFESSIDVDEAVDFLRFYALTMREMNGFQMEMGRPFPNERCHSVMKPYGTFAIICPFNFPVAITTGMTIAALIAGNTAVMKPSTKGVLAGWKCFQLMKEAGIPDSALHFVVGPDSEVAVELTSNPGIDGLAFTGSKHIGFAVQQAIAAREPGTPVIAEMGGKNSITVTANADLDKAVEGAYRSAFGFSGQKCSACSRILVDKSVKDEFVARLKARMEETVIGLPWEPSTFMGPVIEGPKVEAYKEAAALAAKDGTIVSGGKEVEGLNGHYVYPTLVTDLPRGHDLFHRELFLPFAGVWEIEDLDDALELANSVEYGLTAGIFTEDAEEAERFFNGIQSGVTYLNRKAGGSTAAVVNGQSFVGWKHSGATGFGAGGRYYLLQFMREQSQTRCVD